ncbi:MAG: glutamine synthetase [Candidatus Kerfeldbacteria bacterium]|nr:glutamine synthetase [Candidatus Kerfeldbacteria bacterium]
MTKAEILKKVKSEKVTMVGFWFTDILGQLKGITFPVERLARYLDEGAFFDGSSIDGFARIEESDLVLKPILESFAIIPLQADVHKIARFMCTVHDAQGRPYHSDPREVLRRNVQYANSLGYTYYTGPELEYFYFKNDHSTVGVDDGGYFDQLTMHEGTFVRERTVEALEKLGYSVERGHHEVAASQQEINMKFSDALTMGDIVMTYKYVVKEIARELGVYATFMPKPIFGVNGSGMHVHQSLWKGGKNVFYNKTDEYGLSEIAKSYVAGILKHMKEIVLVTNQYVNSYKRLVPGYEAPAYLAWGRRNRSALIRIPLTRGEPSAARIELRCPDPAANPYLAFAVILRAGLQGIQGKYKLVPATEGDIFEMSTTEMKRHHIDALPGSLREAIEYAEGSSLLKETLGTEVHEKLIESKVMEWNTYRRQVHQYEIDTYLPKL